MIIRPIIDISYTNIFGKIFCFIDYEIKTLFKNPKYIYDKSTKDDKYNNYNHKNHKPS